MDEEVVGKLSAEEGRRLLGSLMLAWDGQWFLKAAEACGLEKAVALNAKVRTSFGRIEIREFLKAKGHGGAKTVGEAVALLEEYQRIFLGDGMAATWEEDEGSVTVSITRCSPQQGAGKAGLRPDTPCVACETVWSAWLETALPGSRWTTAIEASMGRGASSCRISLKRVGAGD